MHRFALSGSALIVAVVLAGCSAAAGSSPAGTLQPTVGSSPAVTLKPTVPPVTPIPGCLPGCVEPNLKSPGALSAGDYTSRYFFGGHLTVTIPDATWLSREDSTGELELHQGNAEDRGLEFWLDVYPIVDPTSHPVPGYDGTAKALVDWVAANPQLTIDKRVPGMIGSLTGEVIEFEPARDAKNLDPGCPTEIQPCIGLFAFPQWDGFVSEGGPFKCRLYAADATWGGTNHAVYAFIWGNDVTILDAFASAANKIIEGARLPQGVGQ